MAACGASGGFRSVGEELDECGFVATVQADDSNLIVHVDGQVDDL
jgi:hypothetical protein